MFHTTCTHPGYCCLADAIADLPGFHVTRVDRSPAGMRVHVETDPGEVFCPICGVQAVADGRQQRLLHDIGVFGVPVLLVWSRRTWRCRQHSCPQISWGETTQLAPPRKHFTTRAITWAVNQLLTRDVVVSALARDLQVGWRTLWKAIEGPLEQRLKELADQASVEALGLDEHVWRHSGPHKNRMITGVVDHTRPKRGKDGKTKPFARLLDVQVGRSGAVAEDWLASQGKEFASKIRIAAIDPYRGYANAISATLKEADMVVDIFHVTKLASQALDEVRRRVQQDTLGRRGHAKDPLYRARRLLLTGANHLTEKMATKLDALLQEGDPNWEVTITWTVYQKLIDAYQQSDSHDMVTLIDALKDCPIPEVARLGRTLKSWKREILAYWHTVWAVWQDLHGDDDYNLSAVPQVLMAGAADVGITGSPRLDYTSAQITSILARYNGTGSAAADYGQEVRGVYNVFEQYNAALRG